MSGNREGGLKAAEKNKLMHGNTFYHEIGKLGGQASKNGGFASDKVGLDGLTGRERAGIAGTVGGKMSRRGPSKFHKSEPKVDKKRFLFFEEL